ncbi:MAG TPA: transcription termination factor NusA [Synergistales bacterium]|jgi:N utilization substance protein A|nr:transcription termination factor NusA [Synergistaceae bacterium]NLD96931.1 transcription termination/antitermination protein NusA [Synergistaceae bacterium]HPE64582.1 transcription termination factor NusA [Synergistales bacterium]HRV98323.1 transcription termination factor NusA [Aminobacteriaceae bacterium]
MQLGRDFARALAQITKERGLSQEVIASSLEAALISAYKKFQGGNQDVEVFIDTENGDISICEVKQIVDVVTSPDVQISLEDAQSQGFVDVAEGDYIRIERDPENFGRIAAQTARQVIIQRLKDAERQIIFEEFSDRVGDLVTGVVFKSENDQVLIRLNDRTEAILPREERIVSEKYIPGERMKLYLLDVRQTTRGPRIVVSRTHPGLLRKLLELEVPEIREGVIDIKNIVREAGARAKIAVQTLDVNVDPVGACVGNNGARIKSISKELCGEKVDVIVWSSDPLQYVRNALSPAKIVKIEPILEQEKAVTVYARPDQLSLAIGKAGQNVRLAARLTGWKIDINALEPERMPTLHDIFQDIIEEEGSK